MIRKYYFFDASKGLGGGVYIWKTKEAAPEWHGEEYKARIKVLYGSEARMTYYDTLIVVDNKMKQVFEPIPT